MTFERLALSGLLLFKPRVFRDARGHFLETWRASGFESLGIGPFVQDNVSVSRRGILRGLHWQQPHGQGKLVSVLRGRVFDAMVDIRSGSPTFGRWVGVELSDENGWQLYIPTGYAHGFLTLTDDVVFTYKCTDYYAPAAERTVCWNDPAIAIVWPLADPELAPRDAAAPRLADVPADTLPTYEPSTG